jgi:ribosome-associated protein
MDIRKLQRAIVDGLEDVKAVDIRVFNTEHLSPLFERVVVASGTSNRQTKALASSVRESVKAKGFPVPRSEGEDNGEWIIVDCGAAVAHIMQPAIRDYYRLEEIWGDKPVSMRIASQKGLPKASEDSGLPTKAPVKAAVKKPATGKPAKSPAAKAPAKAAAKKAAPKKAPARKVVAKKVVAKTPATPFGKRT